ncbi:MAG: 30S ribosomal protein S17 [bacterium]
MPKKRLIGKIVSDKMQKTVVISVETMKEHPKYRKKYKTNKNYKAHCEKEEYKVGDIIIIEECRPISKDKTWKVIGFAEPKISE